MPFTHILLAILGGAVMPVQAGLNRELGTHLGSPLLATLNNFVGGTIAILVVCIAARVGIPDRAAFAAAPWWSWLGGLCGATLVLTSTIAVSRIGSAGLVAGLLAGQLICSLVIDQTGALNHAVRAITPMRMLGVLLLISGVVLIQRH
jgi:bacterial/archaeal transporter family-2 protein